MKSAELILGKNKSVGQSLLELIVAIGIFSAVVGGLALFILNSYVSGRLAYEITKADFLAQEGIEAARSIRDAKWEELKDGKHALSIVDNKWSFHPSSEEEDFSDRLNEGRRSIEVESVDQDRKKITSTITWKFSENRKEEVKLVSYLTNWQKVSAEIRRPLSYTDPSPRRTTNPGLAYDPKNGNTFATTLYDTSKNPSILFRTWEFPTTIYGTLSLNYRYHADGGATIDDRYAVAYSITGCNGSFINLIPSTSSAAPDTTISVNLPPKQDFSRLCVKIYTQRVDSRDSQNIYTRDVWTEGMP